MAAVRTGRMNVCILNDQPGNPLNQIAAFVETELAKSEERLVRLVGQHWTGTVDGPTSPYMTYHGVEYEAEAIRD